MRLCRYQNSELRQPGRPNELSFVTLDGQFSDVIENPLRRNGPDHICVQRRTKRGRSGDAVDLNPDPCDCPFALELTSSNRSETRLDLARNRYRHNIEIDCRQSEKEN